MTISQAYELATDGEFRLLAGFTSPPRGGEVTAIEASGQVRVAMDDADGADVLAWPLNGFTFAVGDIVYVAFAADSPESGIVIGSKGGVPVLAGYAQLAAANAFTQEQSITEENSALYAAGDASHNAFLGIDNPSHTTGTSAGIAFKVENATGALQRWFMGLVSTASNYARFVIKQRTGASTYAERLTISDLGAVALPGPSAGQDTLALGGVSGKSNIKSSTPGLVMDSAGDAIYLNYFSTDDVIMAVGGGYVGVGNVAPGVITPSFTQTSTAAVLLSVGGDQYGQILAKGSVAGQVFLVDTGAAANAKWVELRCDGGITKFYSVKDDASAAQIDNILVMDHLTGKVGIRVVPQQAFHVHNGVGGMMFATAQTASTTAVVIIADGAGDVVRGLSGHVVVTDGSATAANTFSMLTADTLDIAVGSLVLRLTVTSTGQMDVRRQSGTGTATVALMFTWL